MTNVTWIGDVTIVDALHVACAAPKKIWNQYVRLRTIHGGKLLFAVCANGEIDSVHATYAKAEKRAKAVR